MSCNTGIDNRVKCTKEFKEWLTTADKSELQEKLVDRYSKVSKIYEDLGINSDELEELLKVQAEITAIMSTIMNKFGEAGGLTL